MEYYQISESHKRKSVKISRNKEQNLTIFYEWYENNVYFRVVWQNIGTGGVNKLIEATRISEEDFLNANE